MKIHGNQKYLFALMDDETRYLIAQEVANRKEQHDAKRLFRSAKEMMGKTPIGLITDGLCSYWISHESEFKNGARATSISEKSRSTKKFTITSMNA
jgi:transposase-like protein